MKNHTWKNMLVPVCFMVCLVSGAALLMIMPKDEISKSERRRLAQKPELTFEKIQTEAFMENTEEYLLDHFPFREQLRRIKAVFAYNVLQQKENNGIYVAEGHASKLEYVLNESSVMGFTQKLLQLKKDYFPNQEVYYSIIPDKNFFLADKEGYPVMYYQKMTEILSMELSEFSYIDLFPILSVEDYYKTDTHWRQECILDVAQVLINGMDKNTWISVDINEYKVEEIDNFYGVYCGQSALNLPPDVIKYLINDDIENASVWNAETNSTEPVYRLDKLQSSDSVDMYDIFMGGASPIQVIEKKTGGNNHLVVFRDSYTSSLAPLMLSGYDRITLIDLRYISSKLLGKYVEFEDADILFLYNTLIVNNSNMLK